MATPETVLHLRENLRFTATTPSGFELEVDSPATPDAALAAPTPMELQLVALGGCGAMDVISILRKMRQDVISYDVRLTHTRTDEHPTVYTSVQVVHVVRGRGIAEANVRRAIELSITRYCPVYAMLHPPVPITERYEIIDETTGSTVTGEVPAPDASAAGTGG